MNVGYSVVGTWGDRDEPYDRSKSQKHSIHKILTRYKQKETEWHTKYLYHIVIFYWSLNLVTRTIRIVIFS